MPNGNPLSLEEAQKNIRAFVNQEKRRTLQGEKNIVVGQKFDLDVLRTFLDAIDRHDKRSEIDAVRIYFAKSNRRGKYKSTSYDVVLVPVLKKNYGDDYDRDLHAVYQRVEKDIPDATIIGNSLPCPNVCPPGKKNIGCGNEPENTRRTPKKKKVAKKRKSAVRKK